MNSSDENTATKIIYFDESASPSVGSNLRDNVLSTAGANRNLSVVIACDTVILYGQAESAYAIRAIEQVTEAGGLNCMAFLV